jgi:hypothetical protein
MGSGLGRSFAVSTPHTKPSVRTRLANTAGKKYFRTNVLSFTVIPPVSSERLFNLAVDVT